LQLDGKNRATPPMAGTLTTFIAGPLAVIDLAPLDNFRTFDKNNKTT